MKLREVEAARNARCYELYEGPGNPMKLIPVVDSSGIQGMKLLLFKVDLAEIEDQSNEQSGEHSLNQDISEFSKSDSNEAMRNSYLIFEVLIDQNTPVYLPHMIINMSKKFMIADEQLKRDIKSYL